MMAIDTHPRPAKPSVDQKLFLLTVPEACRVLRISRWTFYRLVNGREIETVKIGKRRLVSPDALDRFVTRVQSTELIR